MFFTHDDVTKAMRVLRPDLTHGVDFITVMGINDDGSPASDGWIENWKGVDEIPAIPELKIAVAGLDLNTLPLFGAVTPRPEKTLQGARIAAASTLATRRYVMETSGITLNGVRIKTDRSSQAAITAAYVSMSNGLLTSVDWKVGDGVFILLDLPTITTIAAAVTSHVQRCFTAEKLLSEQVFAATTIEAVTTLASAPLVI